MAKLDIEAEAKTFVQASPERVYDAFATAEGLDGWFTRGAKVDARPGGELLFGWKDWGADLIDAVAHGKSSRRSDPSASRSNGGMRIPRRPRRSSSRSRRRAA